ncbi:MAG: NADP-dependent isocitrate dehydrogenase [Anaerolineaceae bacterium]
MKNPPATPFQTGNPIQIKSDTIIVPSRPIIPFIEGDGCGVDIWPAARMVIDAAVRFTYQDQRQIAWVEVLAGEKAQRLTGKSLPEETLDALRNFRVGIKGPLTTPVGGGTRSFNVALRKALDLYACIRPVRWFEGVPAPTYHPERANFVIFRENTEDLYSGIEFPAGTEKNARLLAWLQSNYPEEYERLRFPDEVGLGLKPVSREGSIRLVRAAIRWAMVNHLKKVTLVHKGNIMKYTEGAFRQWGYELARQDFDASAYTLQQWEETRSQQGEEAAALEKEQALEGDKIFVNDIITDAAFERTLTHPEEFEVLATTNLNGDYLSDALAAQVGGLGIAPGANINFETGAAIFEATHGTAPTIAGKNIANPTSLILSGQMMLNYLGWKEAAALIEKALEAIFKAGIFTQDFVSPQMAKQSVSTSDFTSAVIEQMAGLSS